MAGEQAPVAAKKAFSIQEAYAMEGKSSDATNEWDLPNFRADIEKIENGWIITKSWDVPVEGRDWPEYVSKKYYTDQDPTPKTPEA